MMINIKYEVRDKHIELLNKLKKRDSAYITEKLWRGVSRPIGNIITPIFEIINYEQY